MKNTENYYKPIQLKLPVDYERIIDINDSVYSFVEVLDQIDLKNILQRRTAGQVAHNLIRKLS